jgi:hypothetical protein
MEKNEYKHDAQVNYEQDVEITDRRDEDRRKECREGFTYVSTVGWICRREQLRRKDD